MLIFKTTQNTTQSVTLTTQQREETQLKINLPYS